MFHFGFLVLASYLSWLVNAQLPLPKPAFLPPDASAGAQPSSGYPNPQWSTLLGNSLYFYEAQRSGNLPSGNRVTWRNSSALNDGKDVGLDLTGGYYDAGDYIKATFPLSATIMSICWGAMDYGKAYDLANQTAYLDSMLRWGLDYLIKAHPAPNTLYVLVGNTNTDDEYWGGDLGIPGSRPSYQINATNPGTDAAAGASAAFSACSALYSQQSFNGKYSSPASLGNSTYAATLLTHAQQLYNFAVNAPGGQKTYQTSVPAVAKSYMSNSFTDELTIAALFLSWATNSSSLYQEAESYYSKFGLSGGDDVFNWDSKTPGLAVLFAQITQSSTGIGGNLASWQQEAERYFDVIVNQKGRGKLTKNGLLFYKGDSDSASLNPALNAAMLMTRYAPIASSGDKTTSYLNFAQNQMNYALGKNPMSVPYIVGSNPNSPSNPHSAPASGGNDIGNINTSPPKEAYVIYGAVIGGPDQYDNYYDIRNDWPETEVALDYNAPMLTLTAMHVLNDTTDPFFTSLKAGAYDQVRPKGTPCDEAYPCAGQGLSSGARIAIAVTVTIVGLAIAGLVLWYTRYMCGRKKRV